MAVEGVEGLELGQADRLAPSAFVERRLLAQFPVEYGEMHGIKDKKSYLILIG